MRSVSNKIRLRGPALLGVFFCITGCLLAQTNKNKRSQHDEKLLRSIVRKIESSPGAPLGENFTYARNYVDLNDDGRDEVVVWIPEEDMGGTSGYPILILSRTKSGYRKLMDIDQGWTPVIALKSKRNGWRDLAFVMGGGGAEWVYFIYKSNGKVYKYSRMQKEQPKGDILIQKDWKQTLLGPVPKQ